MSRLLGDSVLAAAVVIPAFLFLSGLASWRAQHVRSSSSALRVAVVVQLVDFLVHGNLL
jgi:predicted membrane-bound spermidine synthase